MNLDISVVHAPAQSYINRSRNSHSAAVPLLAAEQRERQKAAKYQDRLRRNGQDFLPFVLESTGAWGPSVVRFVQLLGSHLEYVGSAEAALNRHQQKHPLYVYGLPSGAGFWGFMRRALAVLIARTNSTIFFSACAHTHYAHISNSE